MKGLICSNSVKLSHTRGGGGNSSFQPLKRFTLFSCSSLIFTGLLTVDLNAQDITITNANRNINNATYTNATINSALNTYQHSSGARFSLGLFFTSINGTLDIQRNASMSSWFDLQNANVNQVDISGQTAGINLKRASGSGNNANQTRIGTLNLKEGGRIRSVLILTGNNASIDTLNINGTIVGSNNYGGLNNQNGRINTINVAQGGNIQRGVRNSGTMQTLTISSGGQVQGGVNNSGTLTTLNLNNGGTINGGINNNRTMGNISVSDSTVNGGINNSNANGTLNNITVETGGNVNGGIHNDNANSRITGNVTIKGNVTGKITNAGTITGNVTISDGGTINASNVNAPQNAIDNSGTIQGKIEVAGQNSNLNKNIKNSGSINQGIEIKDNAVIVGVDNSGTVDSVKVENNANITGDISNTGTITQKIEVTQNSTIQNGITNTNRINGIDIANSQIGGNIVNSGQNANTGNISITGTSNVGGSIVNQNGATFNNQITLDANSKLGGISNNANSTMSGQLDLKGEVGAINNAGTFDSQLNLSNKVGEINNAQGGTISNDITIQANGSVGAINNAGTMQSITNNGTLSNITNSGTMKDITNNATTGTLTLTNSGGTIDKVTNGTGATATIHNQGKITNGIINNGGTLTVFNDFRKDESAANGYHTIGEIGKTANGVHIENNNGGKLHLNAWYFNKEDFTTQEERKNNALLVNGNYAGITLGDVFVNTQGLDVDKTYNANTFIADKDGNMVGDKINNGQGIDVNKLHSVSGIYKFENFGGKGEYRAIINRDELSGKSLAQSIIYSQRVRNVNLSRILREATTQVFVSGKEGEVNANGKSLSQLEQLHTNHRDENSQNHTFV
ncbi:S-layer family protein, partial [Campylobacter upsaliensis]|nr:S-layer family protein [Campylobacter upsaliensis]